MPRPDRSSDAALPEPDDRTDGAVPPESARLGAGGDALAALPRADFRDLPVLGFSRRRVGFALVAVVAAWVIVVFARQVGEASAASGRAAELADANAVLAAHVEALEQELVQIQDPLYIGQQARAHRMGNGREIPFQLAADAPPLAEDAPGSASVRVGAVADRPSPLDAWLDLLLGPGT